MIRKRRFPLLVVVIALMFLASGTVGVSADSGTRSFKYLIGSGFLCTLDPSACPVISRAQENDDTIAMRGAGPFTLDPKSVTGGGTFTHKNAFGTVLTTGTWTATELLSFVSYGTSPGLPPTVEGGQALMHVHLTPSGGGAGVDAVLQVHCSVGSPPPSQAEDNIKLAVQGDLNFNKGVSGFTIFIRVP